MKRYAWIMEIDGKLIVKDIVDKDPNEIFHPEVAKNYTEILTDPEIRNGAYFDPVKLKWENIHIPIAENLPASSYMIYLGKKIPINNWKQILAVSETNEYIRNFVETSFEKIIYSSNDQMLVEVLDYLKSLGIIGQATIEDIMERGT